MLTLASEALLASLALLGGFGSYQLLWWMERRFYGLSSTLGAFATLPVFGVWGFGVWIVLENWHFGILLQLVAFASACTFSVWLHSAKYGVPYSEAFLLMMCVVLLATLVPPVVLIALVILPIPLGLSIEHTSIYHYFNLAWVGALSGPALWNYVVRARQEASQWLRQSKTEIE